MTLFSATGSTVAASCSLLAMTALTEMRRAGGEGVRPMVFTAARRAGFVGRAAWLLLEDRGRALKVAVELEDGERNTATGFFGGGAGDSTLSSSSKSKASPAEVEEEEEEEEEEEREEREVLLRGWGSGGDGWATIRRVSVYPRAVERGGGVNEKSARGRAETSEDIVDDSSDSMEGTQPSIVQHNTPNSSADVAGSVQVLRLGRCCG